MTQEIKYELIKKESGVWVQQGRRPREFLNGPNTLSPNKGKWVPRIVEDDKRYDSSKSSLVYSTVVTEDAVTVSNIVEDKTADQLAGEAMNNWQSAMRESDNGGITRTIEDVIDVLTATQLGNLDSFTKDRHAAKKALRAQRPRQ